MAAVGVLGLFKSLVLLLGVWVGDPLRSIGIVIPPVSVFLILRAWKRSGWERRGSWWGLPLIVLAFLASAAQQRMLLMGQAGAVTVSFIPLSASLFLYGAGLVLLLAGWRVCRAARFPILLLMLSQPVPVLSLGLIDGPLQRIAAEVARSFATMIGFAPSTPQLRLMFSPHFGMFIAPGCDGIRGAVTMGYIALLLGYWKRVPIVRWILYVGGAVLLGYVFNFVRLCLLVVYYRIALGHRLLETFGTQADYIIGFCLFAAATALLVWLARRKDSKADPSLPAPQPIQAQPDLSVWKAAALALLVVVTLSLEARDLLRYRHTDHDAVPFAARFPRQIGEYRLTSTKYESSAGQKVLVAGNYAAPGSDSVTLGVWIAPINAIHDSNGCWLVRGVTPDSLKTTALATRNGGTVSFDVGLYTDGETGSVVANTVCNTHECPGIKSLTKVVHAGLMFLKPDFSQPLGSSSTHLVSFMVRIDRPRSGASRDEVYRNLSAQAQRFVQSLDMSDLARTFQ